MTMPEAGPLTRKLRQLAGIDPRSLAAFRIGLATVLLADLGLRARDLAAHYSDAGVLPRQELLAMARERVVPFSLHLASGSVAYQAVLFVLAAVAALALLVGYRSRSAAFVSWLFLLSLHSRNPVILSGGDNLLRVLLFWALFVPLGAAASLDRRWARSPHPDGEPEVGPPGPIVSVGTFAVLFQVTLVYWTTAALKWHPAWIENGTAVFHALHLDQLTTRFGQHLLAYPTLLRWSTFGTVALEIVGPLLAWSPLWTARLRVAMVAVFVGFHLLGLGLALALGIFPWVCAVAWIPFLPGVFWDRLGSHPRARALAGGLAGLVDRAAASRWGRRLRLVHPRRPPRIRPRPLVQALAAVLLVYVAVWNLRTIDFRRYEQVLPRSANPLAFTLRLDQHWNLFAPYPARDDGWYVMPGTLAGGREVDVLTGRAPTFEKPELISATWGAQRWRKYMMNLWEREHAAHRRTYGAWVCRRWNGRHRGADRLESFRMIFLLERSPDPGEPVPTPRRIPLWTQVCVAP